eukprot:310496-Chlamydomonas_euryale.AAC.6
MQRIVACIHKAIPRCRQTSSIRASHRPITTFSAPSKPIPNHPTERDTSLPQDYGEGWAP